MPGRNYSIEELMLDDSFLNYCLEKKDADKAFWEREMEFDITQRAIILEAKYTICLLHGKLEAEEVSRQVEAIRKMIGNHQQRSSFKERGFFTRRKRPTDKAQRKRTGRKTRNLLLYSSMVATAIVFTLYFFANPLSKKTNSASRKTTIYRTGMGQRLVAHLPDSSVAILNSNSEMIIGKDFNGSARSVNLNGEAYFRVAKNLNKEFTVKSGDYSATALGTSFYVDGRSSESIYKVDLLEGSVKLTSAKEPKALPSILKAGEEGLWEKSNNTFLKTSSDQSVLKKWIGGKLSFRNLAAGDLFKLLSQWYRVEIQANDRRWSTVMLTGDYDNQTIDEVLRIVCFSLSTSYSYKDNMVIIE